MDKAGNTDTYTITGPYYVDIKVTWAAGQPVTITSNIRCFRSSDSQPPRAGAGSDHWTRACGVDAPPPGLSPGSVGARIHSTSRPLATTKFVRAS